MLCGVVPGGCNPQPCVKQGPQISACISSTSITILKTIATHGVQKEELCLPERLQCLMIILNTNHACWSHDHWYAAAVHESVLN